MPPVIARSTYTWGSRDGMSAYGIAVLVTIGSVSLLPLWLIIGHLWATDPLRSIGALFPFVSLIGVVAAWRRLGWNLDGSLWGILLVGLSILLAHVISVSNLVIFFQSERIGLLHPGAVLFLYGAGVTVLFGGVRLLRVGIAPLCLLFFIDPVPQFFSAAVDLPLQELSALTARAFSHLIGLNPTGAQLRMMFAPDFGMLIVPGCNGVRGSITLAYLVLIFGYSRHLRPRTLGLITLTAGLLGYGLNLLRLCVLVLYYKLGLEVPSIQRYGVEIDYLIGCSLFLITTLGLGLLIRSLELRFEIHDVREKSTVATYVPITSNGRQATVVRIACFVALVMAFILPASRSLKVAPSMRPKESEVLAAFPSTVGPYRLIRTYSEHNSTGMIVLGLGEYEATNATTSVATHLTLGLWVASADHLVAHSKATQGLRPDWTGSFDAIARQSIPIDFASTFYDDGISRQYNAEAICSIGGCVAHVIGSGKRGAFFSATGVRDLLFVSSGKRLPIFLRGDWPDSDPAQSSNLRTQFESDSRVFMEHLDILPLLMSLGSRT
jgi:exosortase J